MRKLRLLIAEDDANDVLLLRRALGKSGLAHSFHHVPDGEKAIEHLHRIKSTPHHEHFPDLLLTDLKMPRTNGLELLQWLGAQREFAGLPKIVLSSSDDCGDVKNAYALGAHAYFIKSTGCLEVMDVLRKSFHRPTERQLSFDDIHPAFMPKPSHPLVLPALRSSMISLRTIHAPSRPAAEVFRCQH